MSGTKQVLELNGRKIILIGTAHVSKESIEEVSNFIGDTPYIIMSKMDGLTCSLT